MKLLSSLFTFILLLVVALFSGGQPPSPQDAKQKVESLVKQIKAVCEAGGEPLSDKQTKLIENFLITIYQAGQRSKMH